MSTTPKDNTEEISDNIVITQQPDETKNEHPFRDMLQFVIIALLIVIPIRVFIAQPFIVSGASMFDTFEDGQYLIVDQASYLKNDPVRGEVIIFKYPKDTSKFFIKRVIGVPGDTIAINGSNITVTNEDNPGGFVLYEPYVDSMSDSNNFIETLGDDEFFVMGDNRDFSSDSRAWGILSRDKIVGRAFLRLFPVNQADLWPGYYDYSINSEPQS